MEWPSANPAMMPPRLNCPPLASVHSAALPTTPGKPREAQDFLPQGMIDGDRQGAVPVHFGHPTKKIPPMIRPSLQDVELPLMNHFMRQRAHNLPLTILAPLDGLSEQGKGEADFSFGRRAKTVLIPSGPRSLMIHEHAD